MTNDGAGSPLSRLRPVHWVLAGLVVLLVVAGIVVAVGRGGDDSTAGPGAPPSGSGGVTRPDCAPEVTARGASGDRYTFVYSSRCDQVFGQVRFRVTARGSEGLTLADVPPVTTNGGVLFPGQELAATGRFKVPRGLRVTTVNVQVLGSVPAAPETYSGWARQVEVDLSRGEPDRQGTVEVTGTVRAEPASVPVCVTDYVLVLRNRSDKIIYGTAGREPTFDVPPLKDLDLARARIYAPQTARDTATPRPGAACDAG